jgi:phosphosulfolactate phosphohydrolase-like enzyme
LNAGYRPGNELTEQLVERWSSASIEAFLGSKSVEDLKNAGQLRDLDFILGHIDDVDAIFPLKNGEITWQQACDYVEKYDSYSSP